MTEVLGYDAITHMAILPWTDSGSGAVAGISFPFLSLTFVTLNTDKIDAVTTKSVASTKCRPGHIRFPAPNARWIIGSSRQVPSSLRKRSGLNASGSGYSSGSCRTALSIGFRTISREAELYDCHAPPVNYDHSTYGTNDFDYYWSRDWRCLQTFWKKVALIKVILR